MGFGGLEVRIVIHLPVGSPVVHYWSEYWTEGWSVYGEKTKVIELFFPLKNERNPIWILKI
jgi:hypothetical protein